MRSCYAAAAPYIVGKTRRGRLEERRDGGADAGGALHTDDGNTGGEGRRGG